jgi:hypothetical protein
MEANGFLLQDRRATRSLFARTSLDRETSTSSTTTRQCREMKLRYGQERQGMFLLWKNEANGKRHGDDTNHMTPRLRLHWLAHAVFGSDGGWDGITLVSLQESVITTHCLKSSCEDLGGLRAGTALAQQAPTQQLRWIKLLGISSYALNGPVMTC